MLVDGVKWFFKPDSVFATERLAKGEWDVIPSLLKNSLIYRLKSVLPPDCTTLP